MAAGVEILRGGTAIERDSVIRTFYNLNYPVLLQQYLDDPDPNVQIGMVSAIGFLRDKSAAPRLNALLNSVSDYLLRETIVFAIGELGDTSSVPVLVSLLNDPAVDRDLRLSIPITLSAFIRTEAAGKVEQTFVEILNRQGDDIELCSYIAVGILEILRPGNYQLFREQLPRLKQMAEKRRAESGEDGIWTNFDLTIQELENYRPPAS